MNVIGYSMDIGNRWKMHVVKEVYSQNKFYGDYYLSLLLFVTTFLYLCVHVNFYFQVHQGRIRNDIGLVTFCFDHVIICKLRVLSPKT
jgi:hypothetical protein